MLVIIRSTSSGDAKLDPFRMDVGSQPPAGSRISQGKSQFLAACCFDRSNYLPD